MLKAKYEKKEDIPEGYDGLYEERGGEWILKGGAIEGVRTDADVARVQRSLDAEKKAHKKTKDMFEGLDLGELTATEVQERLDGYEELEAKAEAGGSEIDEEKLDKLADQRVKRAVAPLERENKRLTTQCNAFEEENTGLKGTITTGKVHSSLRNACAENKVVPEAVDDVLMYSGMFEEAEDGVVVTKDGGLPALQWIEDQKATKKHWWPASKGGDSTGGDGGGGGAENPWAKGNWNVTHQSALVKEKGIETATRLAEAAGSTIGAIHPPGD